MKRKVINPKTRFSDLVEFYKEIKTMENLTFARLMAGSLDEDKALFFLKQKKREIEARYSNKLCKEDKYEFQSLNKMEAFLEKNGFGNDEIKKAVEHEREHYREILSNGLNVKEFLCWLVDDKSEKKYVCGVTAACEKIPYYFLERRTLKPQKKNSCMDGVPL